MGEHKPRRSTSVKDRILGNIRVDENGCWRWQRYKHVAGYGWMWVGNGKCDFVHRAAYQIWKGPIPDGLVIDHLCRVRDCCNPDHLEVVTYSENTMRGDTVPVRRKNATHCDRNHRYTPETTHISASGNRRCKICRRASQKIYYRRRRAAGKRR